MGKRKTPEPGEKIGRKKKGKVDIVKADGAQLHESKLKKRKASESGEKSGRNKTRKPNRTPKVCEHCGKQLSNKQNYEKHVNSVHYKVVVARCEPCKRDFYRIHHYQTHVNTAHKKVVVARCEPCGKDFYRQHHYKEHMTRLHDPIKVECHICKKTYTPASLAAHLKRKHPEGPEETRSLSETNLVSTPSLEGKPSTSAWNVYEENQRSFLSVWNEAKNKSILQKVMTGIRSAKTEADSEENEDKTTKEELTSNLTETFIERKLKHRNFCKACKKQFDSLYDYNMHVKSEHIKPKLGKGPRKCGACGKTFKDSSGYRIHVYSVHLGRYGKKCRICQKPFRDLHSYKIHFNAVHMNIKAKCHICNKFVSEAHFKKHIRNHFLESKKIKATNSKEVNLAQSTIPSKKLSKETLAQDIESCPNSSQSPEDASNKKEEETYYCSPCDQRFVNSYGYYLHIRTAHKKRGKIVCPECPKMFTATQRYVRHVVEVHNKVRVQCPECKECVTKNYLLTHLKLHATDEKTRKTFTLDYEYSEETPDALVPTAYFYRCNTCATELKTRDSYLKHLREVCLKRDMYITYCKKCGISLQRRSLASHQKMHEKYPERTEKVRHPLNPPFMSPFSFFKTEDFEKALAYLANCKPQEVPIVECNVCSLVMAPKEFPVHYQDHILMNPKYACHLTVKCSKCYRKFPSEELAESHLCNENIISEGNFMYQCGNCNAWSREKRIMRLHTESVHQVFVRDLSETDWKEVLGGELEELEAYVLCHVCGKPSSNWITAKDHVEYCEGENLRRITCLQLVH